MNEYKLTDGTQLILKPGFGKGAKVSLRTKLGDVDILDGNYKLSNGYIIGTKNSYIMSITK